MAGRKGKFSIEQRRQIGEAVARARGNNVDWKVLEAVYNRSRLQLWRYAKTVSDADTPNETK